MLPAGAATQAAAPGLGRLLSQAVMQAASLKTMAHSCPAGAPCSSTSTSSGGISTSGTSSSSNSSAAAHTSTSRTSRNSSSSSSSSSIVFASGSTSGTVGRARTVSTSAAARDYGAYPPMQPRRVVITGIGLVTPLGLGVTQVWERLVRGETAVRRLLPEDLPEGHGEALAGLSCQVAALVPRGEVQQAIRDMQEDPRRTSPFMQYALVAAAEALQDAGWSPRTPEQQQYTGVAIGNGMSSTAEVAEAGRLLVEGKLRKLSPFFVPRILANMAAGAISIRWGLHGPNHCASTACATGAHAIGDAFRAIQRGDANVMLAGASEACVDAIALAGFGRLRALSTAFGRTGAPTSSSPPSSSASTSSTSAAATSSSDASLSSRPFDADRDGFVMGEGAAVLVLEELEHARARGVAGRAYAELRGYGMSGDGHHVTQPHPEALGAVLCMQRALSGSGVAPDQVAYVNAHATSTPQGDEVEMHAVRSVFAAPDGAPPASLAVSSTKGATGHLLGAAGAVEAAFTALAVRHAVAPPTVNLVRPDPPGLLLGLVGPKAVALPAGRIAAMCNSFGFGGTNACLLMASPPAP